MVRLRIIYNRHNARLMHDHVTVISFTLITKLAHQNLSTSVTLASFPARAVVCVSCSHTAVLSRRSVCIHSAMRTVFLLLNTEYDLLPLIIIIIIIP